jgi:hypothetical protein
MKNTIKLATAIAALTTASASMAYTVVADDIDTYHSNTIVATPECILISSHRSNIFLRCSLGK